MIVATDAAELDRLMAKGIADLDLVASHAMGLAKRIAKKTQLKYSWVDADDLQQNLLLRLQKWVAEYDPSHESSTTWTKYLYHKMSYYVLDLLRKEDPLGISWPQRKHYPEWSRLGDADSAVQLEAETDSEQEEGTESDQQFWQDFQAVRAWVQDNKLAGRIRPTRHAETAPGVLRAKRLDCWDHKRNRVRFRRGDVHRFRSFIEQRKRKMEVATKTEIIDLPSVVVNQLREAGREGLTISAMAGMLDTSSQAVQPCIVRMKKDGQLFRVSTARNATGARQAMYALAEFWPDGPPLLGVTPKAKPKGTAKARLKKSACRVASKPQATKADSVGNGDLMLLCETLASLRDCKMKSAVLGLIREACDKG